jgi:ribosome production factor 1
MKQKTSFNASLSSKTANKLKRQDLWVKQKKLKESTRRDERFRRRREEEKDPSLRDVRIQRNIPLTIDRKRVWDEVDNDTGDGLGASVDVERLKRQKQLEDGVINEKEGANEEDERNGTEEQDSMMDSESENEKEEARSKPPNRQGSRSATERATSPVYSTTSTNLDLTPEALAARFPTLFSMEAPPTPKILITTSINSNLHHEAELLTTLFPNSVYIPRSAHRYGHKFSIREIASFATNRKYTAVIVLKEDQKKPTGLDFVHLPQGPMFHFSLSNWVDGKKIPGHGRPTNHFPELILNNFRTPLGLLTAHLFRTMFPPQPEFQGRQVVTLHNQRDYIFLRRHRYVFREKRATEKSVVGPDGKVVEGVEGIRAGLQELGPRFTMKLRRIDKGIQRKSGQEWEWKGGMEKQRTKFQL